MEVTAAERTTTYTGAQSLAAKINGYIVAQRTSIAAIAKEIGYSRVTISRYLSGKYDSDPTGIEEKLAAFLAGQTGETVELPPPPEPGQKGGQKPRFYESRDAKAVLAYARAARSISGWASEWPAAATARHTPSGSMPSSPGSPTLSATTP